MLQFWANNLAFSRSSARLSLLLIWSLLLAPACLSDWAFFSAQAAKTSGQATTRKATAKKTSRATAQRTRNKATRSTRPAATRKKIAPLNKNKSVAQTRRSSSKVANSPTFTPPKPLASNQQIDEELAAPTPDDRELINFSRVTRGLTGQLTTGSAGNDFLAKYNRLPRRTLGDGEKLAALDYDLAPRSTRFLRLSQGLTNRLLVNAYRQTGRPFKTGGQNPMTGFDERGFVKWLFSQEGIRLPAQAAAQVAAGQAVARDELRPGDILVYQMPKETGYVVGVYSGHGNFILASSKHRRVTEAAAFDTEYGPYFVGGRRFLDDPKAAPLSDEIKTEATNGAVKQALAELGDNIPKPANIYGSPKKFNSKHYRKNRNSRRGSKAKISSKKSSVRKTARSRAKR